MQILKGIDVTRAINEQLKKELLEFNGYVPHLAIIRVGERPDDMSYERGAIKRMDSIGLRHTVFVFPMDIDNQSFVEEFEKINSDDDIDGILLLRPLPGQIDESCLEKLIKPKKDLDGISPVNMAKVYAGDETGFAPCTPEAVMEMLDYAKVDLTGKRVTIVGRSLVVGKPLAMLMLKRNATVTICHTRTADIEDVCKNSEIVVAAAGRAKMINSNYIDKNSVVIDVGINVDENGKLCGDVDFEAVDGMPSLITPVPGGVGSVTTSVLAKHLVRAAKAKLK